MPIGGENSANATGRATPRALVWMMPEQAGLVRGIAEATGLAIALVGDASDSRGRGADLAAEFGGEQIDDLRRALATAEVDLVLLAAGTRMEDAAAIRECAERGVRVATLEPTPAGVLEVLEPSGDRPAQSGDEGMGLSLGPEPMDEPGIDGSSAREWAAFVPLARHAPVMRGAHDVIQQLGGLRMVSVQAWGGLGQGSLGARLYDAIECITWLLGQPETIDAALVSATPGAPSAGTPTSPTLRELEGDLSATLRYSGGAAAAIAASNRAGRWSRTITLVGERGRVRIYDDGLEWIDAEGNIVEASRDSTRIRGTAQGEPTLAPAVRVIAEQITRLLDASRPIDPPSNVLSVLATAGAALLSARTGQGESPDVMLRMT